jgi:hypothetical protein
MSSLALPVLPRPLDFDLGRPQKELRHQVLLARDLGKALSDSPPEPCEDTGIPQINSLGKLCNDDLDGQWESPIRSRLQVGSERGSRATRCPKGFPKCLSSPTNPCF